MTNKTQKLLIGMLLLGVVLISFASAEYLACFQKGERYKYCDPAFQQEVSLYRANCGTTFCTCTINPLCKVCAKSYDAEKDCYVPGTSIICLKLNQVCGSGGGSGGNIEFDLTPPVLGISNPVNESIYNSRKIMLTFSLNEVADVYYRDLNKATVSWIRICTRCNAGDISYNKSRTFLEGQNNLLFKAVDVMKNEAYVPVSFFIDSKRPTIYRTSCFSKCIVTFS